MGKLMFVANNVYAFTLPHLHSVLHYISICPTCATAAVVNE